MKKDKADNRRPLAVSAASIVIFLLGLVGTLLGIVAGVVVLFVPYAVLSSLHAVAILFWVVGGPFIILAGYNLWKMKKWAAHLAVGIVLFDFITTLFLHSLWSLVVDIGDILAWVLDALTLILIALVWKHLH